MPLPFQPMTIKFFSDGRIKCQTMDDSLQLKPNENDEYNFVELFDWQTKVVNKTMNAELEKIKLRKRLLGEEKTL